MVLGSGNEVKIVVRAIDKASGTTDKIAGKLSGPLKAGALGAAAAIAGLGVASVKMGMDFEKGMAEVFTLLPQLSEEGFGQLKNDVLDFSKEMGIATSEIVPALYQAISAGVPQENVIDFLRVGAKSSIGGVTDLKTSVDGLTSVTNAWGLQTEESGRVADAMFTAVRLGKTTFGELASSISTVAPLASALDVSLEEVFATTATLTKSGVETAQAMTQMRSALVALQRTTPPMEEALENLGFATGDALLQAHGFQGAMVLLREEADRMGVPLIDLMGRVEGLQAVLGLTGKNAATAKQDLGDFGDKVDDVGAAFGKIDDTAARDLERAINDLNVALMELGTVALPAVAKGAEGLSKFIEFMQFTFGPAAKDVNDVSGVIGDLKGGIEGLAESLAMGGGGTIFDELNRSAADFIDLFGGDSGSGLPAALDANIESFREWDREMMHQEGLGTVVHDVETADDAFRELDRRLLSARGMEEIEQTFRSMDRTLMSGRIFKDTADAISEAEKEFRELDRTMMSGGIPSTEKAFRALDRELLATADSAKTFEDKLALGMGTIREFDRAALRAAEEGIGAFSEAVQEVRRPLEELQTEADETRDALFKMFTEPTQEEANAEAVLAAYRLEAHNLEGQSRDLTSAESDRLDLLTDKLIPAQEAEVEGIDLAADAAGKYARAISGDLPTHQEMVDTIRDQADALKDTNREIEEGLRAQVWEQLTSAVAALKDEFGFADANARHLLRTLDDFRSGRADTILDIFHAAGNASGPVPGGQAGLVVPGLPGQRQLIVAEGGERLISSQQEDAMGEGEGGVVNYIEQVNIIHPDAEEALSSLGDFVT